MKVRASAIAGMVICVGVIALAGASCGRGSESVREAQRESDGPLAGGGDNSSVGWRMDQVGVPVSVLTVRLENSTDEPIIIDEIALDAPTEGLKVLGIRMASGLLTANVLYEGFPPDEPWKETLREPEKFSIPPGGMGHVVIGIQAPGPGKYGYQGVRLRYSQDGRSYEDVQGLGALICAPASEWEERCSQFD